MKKDLILSNVIKDINPSDDQLKYLTSGIAIYMDIAYREGFKTALSASLGLEKDDPEVLRLINEYDKISRLNTMVIATSIYEQVSNGEEDIHE